MTKRQILRNPIRIGGVGDDRGAKHSPPLRALGRQQMALTRVGPKHFASGRDLKSFSHSLAGLDTFWTAHIQSVLKKSAQYRTAPDPAQAVF
jgi:hypothetical protein